MQFRSVLVMMLGFLVVGCGSPDAPPKVTTPVTAPSSAPPTGILDPSALPTAELSTTPAIKLEEKPKTNSPPPNNAVETVPTPPSPEKLPIVPTPPQEAKPAGKQPDKAGKDPKEPKFVEPKAVLGRSFDVWKADIKSKDPAKREKTMKMILNFGPNKAYEALPDIIGELSKHTKQQPIDLSVRVHGVVAMSTILFSKKDPDKKLADDAIMVYKTSLKDRQVLLRTRAVQGVLSLGPRTQELIDEIIDVAHDPNSGELRKEGIVAITRIAVDADKKVHPKALIELHKALNDLSGQVKLAAMQGLIAIGPALDSKDKQLTVDKVYSFLKKKDTDPFLQMAGHVTIMNVTATVDKVHLAPLVRTLTERDDTQRMQALQFLKLFGPKAQIVIDDVLALGSDALTWQIRKEALATGMLLAYEKDKLHPGIVPALCAALTDKAPEVRQSALNGLATAKDAMTKSEVKTTVASLLAFVKTEKEPLLEITAHATIMTLTDNISQMHMDPIVDMIKHKEVAVRLESFRTIGLAGKKAKPFALTAVVEAIRDPNLTVSEAAIDTLPSIHAFETMDLLKKIIADKKYDTAIIEAAQDALMLMEDIQAFEKTVKDKTEKK